MNRPKVISISLVGVALLESVACAYVFRDEIMKRGQMFLMGRNIDYFYAALEASGKGRSAAIDFIGTSRGAGIVLSDELRRILMMVYGEGVSEGEDLMCSC